MPAPFVPFASKCPGKALRKLWRNRSARAVEASEAKLACLKLSGGEYKVYCEWQVEPILRKQKPPACLAAVFDLVCVKLSGGQFDTKYPEQIPIRNGDAYETDQKL